MTTPTAGELALLRTQPHQTNLFLSIYKPKTVFAARVNDSGVAKGDRVITYDTVSAGNWQAVHVAMTLHVGTTPGGKDKGSIYVYGRTSTTLTVGENSHIDWEDDDYLTVVDFYQIWPVYPRYVQSGGDVTVFKAYDVAYTDQNEVLGSLICMGPHHAGFLDPNSGEHEVYWTADGTENMKGHTISYSWEFEGGTPTGSSVQTPGNVTYDTPGHYVTRLTITTVEGETNLSVRHVSIYDRPGEGDDVPILSWGTDGLAGSRNEGGYQGRFWVRENISDLEDGALVVLFADDLYGSTEQSIGGNATNREKTFFVGYILDGSIQRDYKEGIAYFQVGSPTEIMKLGEAFSVSVESSTDPVEDAANPDKGVDPWFYLEDLTVKRAIYHYNRWHNTVNVCCDVKYPDTDYNIQYFDANRTSIYDALSRLMESTVFGSVISDRQGRIYCEINPEATDAAKSSIPLNMFIDNHDWIGQPEIVERSSDSISYLEGGGVAYAGPATGTFSAVLSAAPGSVPAYRGVLQKVSGLALTGQDHLNTLMGNVYASRNSRYPEVTLSMAGNYRNFDITPKERVQLTLQPEDTPVGISWEQKPFVIDGVEWGYDSRSASLRCDLLVAEITEGFLADTILVEEIPPTDTPGPAPVPPPPPIPPPIKFGRYITMNFVIDGGGSVISTGVKGDLKVDFSGRIDGADLHANASGDIVVDIWVAPYGDAPPTNSESITASAPPTLSSAQKSQDLILTGWTRTFNANSVFRFNVDSAATVSRVTLALKIWRD
jgi:hypothetical protein